MSSESSFLGKSRFYQLCNVENGRFVRIPHDVISSKPSYSCGILYRIRVMPPFGKPNPLEVPVVTTKTIAPFCVNIVFNAADSSDGETSHFLAISSLSKNHADIYDSIVGTAAQGAVRQKMKKYEQDDPSLFKETVRGRMGIEMGRVRGDILIEFMMPIQASQVVVEFSHWLALTTQPPPAAVAAASDNASESASAAVAASAGKEPADDN